MKHLFSGALAAVLLFAPVTSFAEDVGFYFNGERFGTGYVSGTLYDLNPDGLSTPSRITFVDQTPPFLTYLGDYAGGEDIPSSAITGQLELTDGVITGGEIDAGPAFHLNIPDQEIAVQANGYRTVFYQSDQPEEGGSPPVFFAYPAAAPEPSTWALMLGGVGAIGLVGRHRRRQPKLPHVSAA